MQERKNLDMELKKRGQHDQQQRRQRWHHGGER